MGQLISRCKRSWEERKSYPRSQVHVHPKHVHPEGYMVDIAMVDCIN